ncbi:alpha/beta hydrolase family protein [Chloroflexota bacterium]
MKRVPRVTSPIDKQHGRAPLQRDTQQWILDYIIQETGKVFHFQGEERGDLPKSVRSHAMISKYVGQKAQQIETLAQIELDTGHRETALDIYFDAACTYGRAQHPIFELNEEKKFLYAGLRRCYDQVCALAPYKLEHIDIPWNSTLVSGNLHINPNVTNPAPLLFYIPGCDVFKEIYPAPHFNVIHQRGMHIFSFDGPGQPESNMRGIQLTDDNYEQAASTALDYLVQRPEIDAEKVVLHADSFGAFWGMRFAARDQRIKAVAATQVSICNKYIQTDLESPRWKQLFAFLTQAEDEETLDRIMQDMTMEGYMEKIGCPLVMTVGEYDPRAPLDEIYPLFDQLKVPAELWIMADQHHGLSIGSVAGPAWMRTSRGIITDWLRDRLIGKPLAHPGKVLWVQSDSGPNSPKVEMKRKWYQK